MPRMLVLIATVLSVVIAGGCHSTPDLTPISYAIVQPQSAETLGIGDPLCNLNVRETGEEAEPVNDPNLPEIQIDVRFIEGPHAGLSATGFGLDARLLPLNGHGSTAQTISLERLDEMMQWTQTEPTSSIIDSPRITLYSGRSASVQISTHTKFVQDWSQPAYPFGSEPVASPTMATMGTGRTIEVAATLDGDEIVLDRVLARNAKLLGIRECEATIATVGGEIPMTWQEPYLLVGTAKWEGCGDGQVCQLRLPADKAIVLPMVYRVEQSGAATARAMAKDGKVVEHYRAASPASVGIPVSLGAKVTVNPLSQQCLVVIRAQVVKEVASAR